MEWQAFKISCPVIYICSNISSTESDVNLLVGKVWAAIGRVTTIRKFNLSDGIKRELFQVVAV